MLDDAIYQHIDTEDYRTRLCSRIAKIDQENEFHSMQLKTTISVYKASLIFFPILQNYRCDGSSFKKNLSTKFSV